MITLIVAVLFGLAFAFLATQNTAGVTLRAGNYIWTNIPLYFIAIVSLLAGLSLAWVLSLFGWASSAMALFGKNRQIHKREDRIQDLEKRIHILEIENAKLRDDKNIIEEEDHKHIAEHQPGILDNLRHNLSH